MNKIILGEQQQEALNLIKDFIHSKKRVFSLVGYAGTGKSTMMKQIIEYLEDKYIRYVLCAPTHKARSVIMFSTQRDAYTLHQILKLSPVVDIMELDMRNLQFVTNLYKSLEIPYDGVLICDESSMINDVLFKLLLSKCKDHNCKIIFLGDKAQLKPVNEADHSLVFSVEDSYELTYIYRQFGDSGLANVLPTLRTEPIPRFKDELGTDGSLICTNNAKDLFEYAIPFFKKAIENQDIFEAKLLAYTNNRVAAFNTKMKSILFPGEQEYNKGEILTAYENFEYNLSSFFNSMDYVIDEEPEEAIIKIPHFAPVKGFRLSLYDYGNKNSSKVFILSKETPQIYIDSLTNLIEETRLRAIEAKARKERDSGTLWKKYYDIINSFASPFELIYDNRVIKKKTFDYGYACTCHKSQGSSINNVFIDMKNISICWDPMEFRQLQYVAVSRARNNAYILQ